METYLINGTVRKHACRIEKNIKKYNWEIQIWKRGNSRERRGYCPAWSRTLEVCIRAPCGQALRQAGLLPPRFHLCVFPDHPFDLPLYCLWDVGPDRSNYTLPLPASCSFKIRYFSPACLTPALPQPVPPGITSPLTLLSTLITL